MTRTTIREHIFKLLFRYMFHDNSEFDEQIRLYFAELPDNTSEQELQYIQDKTESIIALIPDIDEKINAVSYGWPISRIGKAELSILRLAVYEMLYDDDIPVNVAIDEAVELAKKYGADNAYSFVNGVLAKLIKN